MKAKNINKIFLVIIACIVAYIPFAADVYGIYQL